MSAVTVDHLHARYRTSATDARRLGQEVHPLIGPAVAAALLDVTAIPDAEHVCVPSLALAVELDAAASPTANSRAWARELVASLVDRLGDADVVVYRRHADALVDALVGLQTGDMRRGPAWRQAGVVPPDGPLHGPDDVVPALVADPVLLPTVLLAVAASGVEPRLAARSWGALGRAWTRAGHRGARTRRVLPHAVPDRVSRLVAAVPTAALDGPDGDDVVTLLTTLLPVAPAGHPDTTTAATAVRALRQDGTAADAPDAPIAKHADDDRRPDVARRDGGPDAADTDADLLGSGRDGTGDDEADTTAADEHREEPGETPLPDQPVDSTWAGLLLALRPVAALGVAEEAADGDGPLAGLDAAAVVAGVLARLAPVPTDDPVLVLLRGGDPARPATPDPLATLPPDRRGAVDTRLDELAALLTASVRTSMALPADADLTPLWRCTGSIEWSPTWVEVTYPLERVDVAARRAGLDLDPGWVWWLGAVVRFRHA